MLSTQSETVSLESTDFGPHAVGATLLINPQITHLPDFVSFDVETDGTDAQNFVGIALVPDLQTVWYFTELNEQVKRLINGSKLIGHGLKADLHFLHNAGLEIPAEHIYADTQLMSYCIDSTRMKHGLKALALEKFGHKWPSYDEMTNGNKVSLKDQPVEKVARYCGMDALETLRLFYHFMSKMTEAQKRLHWQLELPETIILYLREAKGITLDVAYLEGLKARFIPELAHLEAKLIDTGKNIGFQHNLKKRVVTEFNPAAPAQAVSFFNQLGIEVESADKEALEPHAGNPVVDTFRAYKDLLKLTSTYITGMLELPGLPIVHTTFQQTITMTSRLSSKDPNLQNIPSKGEYGDLLRDAFVAREGMTFLDADFSNMELRVAAHFSQEPVWLEAFNENKDVHQAAADKIHKSRAIGKLFNLSVVYGVGTRKLAKSLKCSENQAEKELNDYWKGLPKLKEWIEKTKAQAHKEGGVRTLLGRWIPYPALHSGNKWMRFEAERQCVNAIVQGSSAEIAKLADIAMYRRGIVPLICCHDEMLVEVVQDEQEIQRVSEILKDCMENVVQLRVPMVADIGRGRSWRKAKE